MILRIILDKVAQNRDHFARSRRIVGKFLRSHAQGAIASVPNKNLISNVAGLPGELMYCIQIDQDLNCRTIGQCTHGAPLGQELLDMVPRQVQVADDMAREQQYAVPEIPLSTDLRRHLRSP